MSQERFNEIKKEETIKSRCEILNLIVALRQEISHYCHNLKYIDSSPLDNRILVILKELEKYF
jgi:hypothetical protein